jgi:hypothetical protein
LAKCQMDPNPWNRTHLNPKPTSGDGKRKNRRERWMGKKDYENSYPREMSSPEKPPAAETSGDEDDGIRRLSMATVMVKGTLKSVGAAPNDCLMSILAFVCTLRLQKSEAIANTSITSKPTVSCSIMAIISSPCATSYAALPTTESPTPPHPRRAIHAYPGLFLIFIPTRLWLALLNSCRMSVVPPLHGRRAKRRQKASVEKEATVAARGKQV